MSALDARVKDEEEGSVLELKDFRWRAGRVALERSAWTESTELSTPALAAEKPWSDASGMSLLVLLYESERAEEGPPKVRAPHAALKLFPDGEVAFFESLPRDRGAGPLGLKYGETLAEARAHERTALKETFYITLTDPKGPLWNPWSTLAYSRRRDLGALFRACVEPALVPYYATYARDFLVFAGLLEGDENSVTWGARVARPHHPKVR